MSQPQTSPQRKILFVDGEAILREVYVEEARRASFQPFVAGDGESAWQLFEKEQPDALVTDLDLPGDSSGAELIERIRSTPLGAVIPVVAVSPGKRDIRGVTDAVIQNDVDDFLEKPVHGERLLWRIHELVEGRPIGVISASGEQTRLDRGVTLDRTTDFLQGKLEDRDVATLFFSFLATGRTGKLCVMKDREVIQIWFRRGWVVFAESNLEGTDFGDWLVRRGRIERGALAAARAEWADVDRALGTLLVARGALGARMLFDEIRASVDDVVRTLFSWQRASFYIEYLHSPVGFDPPETVSLQRSPAHYVVTGVREHYSRERCIEILSTAQGELQVADSAHFILRELIDPYYYENVLAQLGSGATVPKLLALHPFDKDDDALRAVTALWVVGGIVERLSSSQVKTASRSVADSRADRIRKAVASAVGREHPDSKASRDARVREHLAKRQGRSSSRRKSGVASIMTALEKVSAEVAYENGARMLAMREPEAAVAHLEEAIRLAPNHAAWNSLLAQAYLAQETVGPEELDAALQTLKRGAALDPKNGEPYHWLGLVLIRMGHPEEARITLRRSVELGSPHLEETRALLASLG